MTKLWIMGAILIFIGCSSPSFQAEAEFASGCWTMTDTLSADYTYVAPSASLLSVGAHVNFEEEYAYRNFYWKVLLQTSEGQLMDTLFNEVFIDPDGNWQIERDFGGRYPAVFSHEISIPPSVELSQVRMIQYMRDSALCGVANVGLMLDPK